MDVSNILAAQAERHNAVTVEKDNLEIDVGALSITDPNPVDKEEYERDLEAYLQSTARDGVQALLSSLFQLPKQASPDGPLTLLPLPTTQLPRAKPLPKPKPPTKWEKFAAAKGIQKKRREKKVWDEEKQDWVDRWGWKGKNKEKEGQWLDEVKANADLEHDPAQVVREARKARVAKNERQRLQNLARADGAPSERDQRKQDIEKTLATTRISTASMGKFDKKLEGEKKLRGVKRKFDPTELSVEDEKKTSLALISKLDGSSKRSKQDNGVLNVRKAIRGATRSKGSSTLAGERPSKTGSKGKFGGKRSR